LVTYEINGTRSSRYLSPKDLNHTGFFYQDKEKTLKFYRDVLGFTLTDVIPEKHVLFLRLNNEHHLISFFPESFRIRTDTKRMQHAAWEIQTYDELINSAELLKRDQVEVELICRRVPGSNYAVYVLDKEGNRIELAFGIENIGWQGRPKPLELWQRIGMKGTLPSEIAEEAEEVDAVRHEFNGFADDRCSYTSEKLDAERGPAASDFVSSGEKLVRPFKLSNINYYALSCKELDILGQFYTNIIGLKLSHTAEDFLIFKGRCSNQARFFLEREGKEIKRDREAHGSLICFGMRTYRELTNCHSFLKKRGIPILQVGRYEIPGIIEERYLDVRDPSGNTIRIAYSLSANGLRETEVSKKLPDELPEFIDCN
jgi:catechol 2,3-dioxygenase-like lactoylglutathione lyase family enzyme